MSGLVTGEAVVLGLRPARLATRGLAVAVDVAVAWSVYIAESMLLLGATSSLDSAAVAAVSVAAFVLVQVGIPIVIETLSHGRSLGKVICGLRVVREDGGPIRFRHALVRGAMGAVEIVLTMGVVAAIASLVSARGRRVGDVFAGTLVIRERMPAAQVGMALPPPPPWLASKLGALDLSRVPDGWWLTVRQYLTRVGQLDPQVGAAMAGRLVEDLRGFTGVPGPAGVHPAAYLAAVAGERQVRESRRTFGVSTGVGAVPAGAVPAGAVPGEAVAGEAGAVWAGSGTVPVDHGAAPAGAWASPGAGAGAVPGSEARAEGGAGAMGLGGAAVAGHGDGNQGDEDGDGGGGAGGQRRPRSTGFAPPV
ncbi:integral membrane protein MviN [Streptomyces sp. NBRC 110611]|uniref:RDD family protein n=1 Tax=Streptomyces sp. NBRC 110611 TaxID=1621259 RepID=UPI00082D12FA|nr:RDD family protein [Streptomyces sp. NBRC 110611]GAU68508.1 integral membrane protein MviN [Streptomyces sp. NBRC 110611]